MRAAAHPVAKLGTLGHLVDPQRLGDDLADPHPGVERLVGVLEDHLHLAAKPTQPPAGEPADLLAVEHDATSARGEEAHQQVAGGRLPAAGLPHQGEHLAAAELEADAVDGTDRGAGRRANTSPIER